jgi:hypothetical protein
VAWIVIVSFSGSTEPRRIKTDVKDERNAIPQAKARNEQGGFDWENAEVEWEEDQ